MLEDSSEIFSSTGESGHYRTYVDIGDLSDFLVAELVHFSEDKDQSFFWAKLLDSFPEVIFKFLPFEALDGGRLMFGRIDFMIFQA